VTSEVGTGAYRAPECLFSPLKGYSADKVDIWQAGSTLVQFFMPLRRVQVTKQKAERANDDRQEWEKALWADDGGLSWSQLEVSKAAHVEEEEEEKESSDSGWKRETLFEASRGDIGLANSIFELRGLPSSTLEWPEAEHFQPSLQRMPFPRRPAAPGGLRHRLIPDIPPSLSPIVGMLDQCIQLSSSKRLSADDIIKQL
jgi:serine/threonine protein kinase